MYNAIKTLLLQVMKVPPEPRDPMGDVTCLRVFRAAPRYLTYLYLAWAGKQLFALLVGGTMAAAAVAGLLQDPTAPFGPIVAVMVFVLLLYLLGAIISFFLVRLDYELRWYKVTDRSLRIRHGVWFVREHTVTYANIQNINVTQGPLQRLLGIADVKVETAGGGAGAAAPAAGGLAGALQQAQAQAMLNMHQAVFRGVDNAEEIRDLMLQRLRLLRDAGLGDTIEISARAAAPAPAAPLMPAPWGAEAVEILAALRTEAAALRRAAEQLSPAPA